MLYCGVSWNAVGFEVAIAGPGGESIGESKQFAAGAADDMIGYLLQVRRPHVTVVDSTNGILDGRMMAAGLTVYRADPEGLPQRPAFGSVPAASLAQAAGRDLSALAELKPDRGTQTGREADVNAGICASAATLDELTSAGQCLSNGARDAYDIALTFDDGPLPRYTEQVLDVLERYGVRATFFCVGLNALAYPDQVRRIQAGGHRIGNHTWSHPFLHELTRPQLVEQVTRTSELVAQVSGTAPALFRPPYGTRSPQILRWLTDLGPTITLWDVEPFDWASPGADAIARTVLDQARPGSIVLLHDGGGDRSQTVASLPAMIEGLFARGFQFVLVDELRLEPSRASH